MGETSLLKLTLICYGTLLTVVWINCMLELTENKIMSRCQDPLRFQAIICEPTVETKMSQPYSKPTVWVSEHHLGLLWTIFTRNYLCQLPPRQLIIYSTFISMKLSIYREYRLLLIWLPVPTVLPLFLVSFFCLLCIHQLLRNY